MIGRGSFGLRHPERDAGANATDRMFTTVDLI